MRMRDETKIPTPKEVQEIFKYTYLFYTKWIAVKEINWNEALDEARELESRYPFELCRMMLVEIVNIIEKTHMERGG
jgi:hypothetical protein